MPNQHDALSGTEGDEPIPAKLISALNESEYDLRHGRLENIDDFIARMETKLQDHLASKMNGPRPADGPVVFKSCGKTTF